MINARVNEFHQTHRVALQRLWFIGDVHSDFEPLAKAMLANPTPSWIIFLGDLDLCRPFREVLAPLRRNFPSVKIAYIHGNHDGDSWDAWEHLADHDDDVVALHGKVSVLNGIRVAGLGGTFLRRVWAPGSGINAAFQNKEAAMNRGAYQFRDGQRPNPSYNTAIYPDVVQNMATMRADILVTHEAPSCHPYGFEQIDKLTRSMHCIRSYHGHHHDDRSDEYALVREQLGFDAKGVNFTAITNGLGERILGGL